MNGSVVWNRSVISLFRFRLFTKMSVAKSRRAIDISNTTAVSNSSFAYLYGQRVPQLKSTAETSDLNYTRLLLFVVGNM